LTEDDLLASDALFSELSYSVLFKLADKKDYYRIDLL